MDVVRLDEQKNIRVLLDGRGARRAAVNAAHVDHFTFRALDLISIRQEIT